MLDTLKIKAILAPGHQGDALFSLADSIAPADAASGTLNLLSKQESGWIGYNTLWKAALKSLEREFQQEGRTLSQMNTFILGATGLGHSLAYAVGQKKGPVSICGTDDRSTQKIASTCGCRFVPFQNLYETLADLLVIADARIVAGTHKGQLNPSLFRPSLTVLDIAHLPVDSPLMEEARNRGSRVIDGFGLYQQLMSEQFRAMTGKELPEAAIAQGMSGLTSAD